MSLIDLAERGRLPDALVRLGIREPGFDPVRFVSEIVAAFPPH